MFFSFKAHAPRCSKCPDKSIGVTHQTVQNTQVKFKLCSIRIMTLIYGLHDLGLTHNGDHVASACTPSQTQPPTAPFIYKPLTPCQTPTQMSQYHSPQSQMSDAPEFTPVYGSMPPWAHMKSPMVSMMPTPLSPLDPQPSLLPPLQAFSLPMTQFPAGPNRDSNAIEFGNGDLGTMTQATFPYCMSSHSIQHSYAFGSFDLTYRNDSVPSVSSDVVEVTDKKKDSRPYQESRSTIDGCVQVTRRS